MVKASVYYCLLILCKLVLCFGPTERLGSIRTLRGHFGDEMLAILSGEYILQV